MPVRTITLRAGTVVAAALLAGLPLAGIASAAPAADKDCRDFPSQAAAQAALDADPSDPNRLDANHNGIACEEPADGPAGDDAQASGQGAPTPSRPDQVVAVPSGSIDAGDGSGSGTGPAGETAATFVLVGFGAVVGAGGCAAVWRTRRSGAAVPHADPARSTGAVRRTDAPAPIPAPRAAADDVSAAVARHR